MKRRADERNILATAEEKGLEKGMQQGKQEGILQIARNMKAMGVSIDIIKQCTNLTEEEIQNL
jgi:predicted transposase/invertase (TIGR01784 family)